MKKIKIALIITLILSISFMGIYIIGYPKLAKKGNIDVKYASEIKDNKEEFPTEKFPTDDSPDSSTDSTSEEDLEIVAGYFQYILTIETSEHLKEGWILATIEGTVYNAYEKQIFLNENNEQIFWDKEHSSWDNGIIFTDDNGNTYYLYELEFSTEEDSSTAKFWANDTTYITIFPLILVKNPSAELINKIINGEDSE